MSDQTCDFAAMAATTSQHEQLRQFEGTFRAEVKLWMGPGDPHVSTGRMISLLELGNRFLHQRYQGDPSDGPFPDFEGRGYWGFNTAAKKWEGFWIDTASTIMQHESGDVDDAGKVWTMLGECSDPMTNEKMQKKSVITLIDEDHHSLEMYFVTGDGNEMKGMEIQYSRA